MSDGHAAVLRRAQVLGHPVVVHMRDVPDLPSPWVTGAVRFVAPSDAYADVGGTHVPLDLVLRVETKASAR